MKFDTVNILQFTVICFCGVGLIVSIVTKSENLAMVMGSGLVGYLGGVNTIDKPYDTKEEKNKGE